MVEMSNLASGRNFANQRPMGMSDPAPPTAPMNNSLVRMANSFGSNIDKLNTQIQNGFNSVSDTVRNGVTNTAKAMNLPTNLPALAAPPMPNMPKNVFGNTGSRNASTSIFTNNAGPKNNSAAGNGEWKWPLAIFSLLVIIFIGLFYFFVEEIKAGYENLINAIRSAMGANVEPPVPITTTAPPPTTQTIPETPETPSQLQTPRIVESVLPIGGPPEVINVSKNDFT